MKSDRRRFIKQSIAASMVGILPVDQTIFPMLSENPSFLKSQKEQRQKLLPLLGDLPENHKSTAPKLLKKEKHQGFTLEYLEFDFNGIEKVPGILLVPDNMKDKAPCMLYCHAHFGIYKVGKDELLDGRSVMPAYAEVYAEKGIMTLAIDSWCFGERNRLSSDPTGETDLFKEMLWKGQTLFGMMLWDEMKALDYLLARPEVDATRVGVFGLSMGATKAWWLAALDTRITTCLDLCCLTEYEELMKIGNLSGHGIYYYVPSLLKHFSTSTINELIVPRPHLSLNGRLDLLTPPAGVEKVRDYLLPLYKKRGKEEDCHIELFDCPHEELPEMRALVLGWLDKYLVKG